MALDEKRWSLDGLDGAPSNKQQARAASTATYYVTFDRAQTVVSRESPSHFFAHSVPPHLFHIVRSLIVPQDEPDGCASWAWRVMYNTRSLAGALPECVTLSHTFARSHSARPHRHRMFLAHSVVYWAHVHDCPPTHYLPTHAHTRTHARIRSLTHVLGRLLTHSFTHSLTPGAPACVRAVPCASSPW